MSFVKPNAIRLDPRNQDLKDAELSEKTSANMFHMQKQLHAAGTSLEAVIAAAASAHMGVRVTIHAPVEKPDAVLVAA